MTRVPVALAVLNLLLASTDAAPALSAQREGSGSRGPSFSYTQASGCEGLFLYAWNEGRTEVLTVRVDRTIVKLADGTTTLNLATAGEGVVVRVELTSSPRETMPYCSEAGQPTGDRPSVWIVRGGTLKVMARKRASVLFTPVSVTLENLVVESPEGAETRVKRTIRFVAAVSDLTP